MVGCSGREFTQELLTGTTKAPGQKRATDPGLLLENVMGRTLTLLNDLMTETRRRAEARRSGFDISRAAARRAIPVPGTWNEPTRLSVRWQLGIYLGV
jgi:hypothetical protein